MKIKGKKIVAVLCAVCALNFMAVGCGNDSAAGETSEADVTGEADGLSLQMTAMIEPPESKFKNI